MIASVVRTWTLDKIPQELYDKLSHAADEYTKENHLADVVKGYEEEMFKKRLADFKEVLAQIKNNKLTPNDLK